MKKELEKKYNHLAVEENKYDFWMEKNLFVAENDSNKPPYSIVIPPPNVTGKLHLGHAWDGALQDALIRYKKLFGYDTLWIPGMDHAGIATQVKVEQKLKEQGISRYEIGRAKFLEKAWEWKEEYANTIREQWKKLGLSLDYTKEKFTYSPEMNKIVNYVFVEMYKKGLIYKSKRIINWDPKQKTAISNIEVIYKETNGGMYHFKYILESNSDKYLEVATTRPETMFGDVCVVVNPNDSRYTDFIGKNVINPANKQVIPVIADEYVDIAFGTGVMKCTPAHDINDFELGLKYNLEMPICMNTDGTLNELTKDLEGLDRFEARENLVKKLKNEGTFIKKEDIVHQVGYSERSGAIVEQYLSEQWFVKMESLATEVINLQNSEKEINFYPSRFNEVLLKWMENANDWTISRQLWWGHQIPAWYHKETGELYVNTNPPTDIENWVQDEDVLDTWFSSALWPFSTMDWSSTKDSYLMKRYFPVSTMVTGYDIIFFWVARMIFQSLEFTGYKPFENVLIHGLIRDEEGRKMSKSLGNGVDPMKVIEDYGADALRFFLLTNSTPGQDLRYSEEKIRSSWNFVNKIWNASRFVMMYIDVIPDETNFILSTSNFSFEDNKLEKWILNRLSVTKKEVKSAMDKFEFTIAGKALYNFIWNDYCSWFLELAKAKIGENNKVALKTKETLGYVLKHILIMLHPFMPFVTEEIYQNFDLKESIMLESWSEVNFAFENDLFEEVILESITKIREFRAIHNIKNTISLSFYLNYSTSQESEKIKSLVNILNKYLGLLCNSNVSLEKAPSNDITSIPLYDCFLEILNSDFIDKEKQLQELISKKIELENEITRSKNLLNNENFLKKANASKVENERKKYDQYENQYNIILEKLSDINKND